MLFTAVPTNHFGGSCTYPSFSAFNPLCVEDLMESLSNVAYNEELAKREQALALKRRREEEVRRRKATEVRVFEHDSAYEIQLHKEIPSRQNFNSYQIQYFKKQDYTLLRISSEADGFIKNYKFKSSSISERQITYKVLEDRVMVIVVPKTRWQEEAYAPQPFLHFIERQRLEQQEAERRRRRQQEIASATAAAQRRRQQEQLSIQKQIQQQKQQQEKARAEREAALHEQRERYESERKERLQAFLNNFFEHLERPAPLHGEQKGAPSPVMNPTATLQTDVSEPVVQVHPELERNDHQNDSDYESATDSETECSTPEFSDVESNGDDVADPDVSDISQFFNDIQEKTTIKSVAPPSTSDIESDAIADDSSDLSDTDSSITSKKRKLRSPSIEEVEDEELMRWKNQKF